MFINRPSLINEYMSNEYVISTIIYENNLKKSNDVFVKLNNVLSYIIQWFENSQLLIDEFLNKYQK